MTVRKDAVAQVARTAGRGALLLAFSAAVVVLMLWLAGKFEPKVPMSGAAKPVSVETQGSTVVVQPRSDMRYETAVGSIRAVHETSVGSRLLARVVEVNVKAGQKVKSGDVLIRLDDTDLKARLQQTKASLQSAVAAREQAAADEKRQAQLMEVRATTEQAHETAQTAVRAAEAAVAQAEETVKEVEATLDWATIRAPMDSVVIDKKVDVGDTVVPGHILVTLFDPKRMQLVASVRESLAHKLQVGQEIGVRVDGLGKRCEGTISEIVPEAQSSSRTFQVKVTGPCPPGIYAGMFGRIYIPLGEEHVLVVPRKAVRNVGQLELVEVVENDGLTRRAIRTGRVFGNDVEVLSGLEPGERVVVPGVAAVQEASHEQ